jgi:hypothetical protein
MSGGPQLPLPTSPREAGLPVLRHRVVRILGKTGKYTAHDSWTEAQPPTNDVLWIRFHPSTTYSEHFPAYSISNGILRVSDLAFRIAAGLNVSVRHVKLYYKGLRLMDPIAAVREYGVKDNSEILVVVNEQHEGDNDSDTLSDIAVIGMNTS